jgi:hypothetical protein
VPGNIMRRGYLSQSPSATACLELGPDEMCRKLLQSPAKKAEIRRGKVAWDYLCCSRRRPRQCQLVGVAAKTAAGSNLPQRVGSPCPVNHPSLANRQEHATQRPRTRSKVGTAPQSAPRRNRLQSANAHKSQNRIHCGVNIKIELFTFSFTYYLFTDLLHGPSLSARQSHFIQPPHQDFLTETENHKDRKQGPALAEHGQVSKNRRISEVIIKGI